MLVRRLSEAPVIDVHQMSASILMDAGELGSRNLSATWLELPAGASEQLRSNEEAEQLYVIAFGSGRMAATGEEVELSPGDLVMIPPATDHRISAAEDDELVLVSVNSPGVSADELYGERVAAQAQGYDDYDDDYEES
ncbi:cupin domain-containing protein [Thermoleophilia bacterium SCSIO 60948]|nr:cupin domain-containing protein [Thermoleophilia bacterium SCSIO 60948]